MTASTTSELRDAPHDLLMRRALAQAKAALLVGEIPVGAVVYHQPSARIIAEAHNRRQIDRDPTAHAELLAMRQAATVLNDWRLLDCTLAVTLEPCPMCAGAMVNARVPTLLYGCDDPKAGAVRTLYRICEDERLNHRLIVHGGLLAEECATLLREFFQAKRRARLSANVTGE